MSQHVTISLIEYNHLKKCEAELNALPYWQPWQDEVLLFGVNRGHSRKEIADTLGKTRRQLNARLYILRERGQVV